MSNIIQPNQEQIEKQKYLDLLGSPDFPKILQNYQLDFINYNKLFAAHVLMIGLQTTSVREGSLYLVYLQKGLENGEFSNITPELNFYFTLTNNSVITKDKYCTNSAIKIHHKKHSFSFNSYGRIKEYHSPREFRDFLLSYQSQHFITANDHEDSLFKSCSPDEKIKHNIKLSYPYYGKVSKLEKLDLIYHHIIEENPELKNFLQYHFLQELHIKSSQTTYPHKIKL